MPVACKVYETYLRAATPNTTEASAKTAQTPISEGYLLAQANRILEARQKALLAPLISDCHVSGRFYLLSALTLTCLATVYCPLLSPPQRAAQGLANQLTG